MSPSSFPLFGKSPSEALASWLVRVRQAVQCVAQVEVLGSGYTPGAVNSMTFVPFGGRAGNVLPLRTRDGRRALLLGIYHHYRVVHTLDDPGDGPYRIESSRYMYELLDADERELFVYHWHPDGTSQIRFPHMHVAGAAPIPLAVASGATSPRRLAIDKAHFPTDRVPLEAFVGLLIRDIAVEPRRTDWEQILADR